MLECWKASVNNFSVSVAFWKTLEGRGLRGERRHPVLFAPNAVGTGKRAPLLALSPSPNMLATPRGRAHRFADEKTGCEESSVTLLHKIHPSFLSNASPVGPGSTQCWPSAVFVQYLSGSAHSQKKCNHEIAGSQKNEGPEIAGEKEAVGLVFSDAHCRLEPPCIARAPREVPLWPLEGVSPSEK